MSYHTSDTKPFSHRVRLRKDAYGGIDVMIGTYYVLRISKGGYLIIHEGVFGYGGLQQEPRRGEVIVLRNGKEINR